jgi:hypothetical protein
VQVLSLSALITAAKSFIQTVLICSGLIFRPNMKTITLQDKATSPTTVVELTLDQDEDGIDRWREFRIPPLPPQVAQGPLSWENRDPYQGLTFSQDDWSGGALKPYYEPGDKRYATAEDLDLRWEGVAALGMKPSATNEDWVISNPDYERNVLTNWTARNSTHDTINSTAPIIGGAHEMKLLTTQTVPANGVLVEQDITGGVLNAWDNIQIRVGVTVRKYLGSGGCKPFIDDGVSISYGTVVTSSSATYTSVLHTISSSATKVLIGLAQHGDPSVANGYFVDDWVIRPPLGVSQTVATAELGGALYAATGTGVYKRTLRNSLVVWEPVMNGAAATRDLVNFNNRLHVTFGPSVDRQYSEPGNANLWTVANSSTGEVKGEYMTVARDGNGDYALWMSTNNNYAVASSINPINSGTAFGGEIDVGNIEHAITALYSVGDTLVVAKEEGLFTYTRWAESSTGDGKFQPVSGDYENNPRTANFAGGDSFQGWVYAPVRPYGLVRYHPGEGILNDLSGLLSSPRLNTMGGVVKAVTNDSLQVWMVVEDQDATSTTNGTLRIMSYRETGGEPRFHMLDSIASGTTIQDRNKLQVYSDNLLHFGARMNSDVTIPLVEIKQWDLPSDSTAPYAAGTPSIHTGGYFETSIWHGGYPDDQKAFIKLVCWVEGIDAEHTIIPSFGVDGDATTTRTMTTINNTVVVDTTPEVVTVYFEDVTSPEANCIGRNVQLRFTFASDDTVSPKLYAFALISQLRPAKLKTWELHVRAADSVMRPGGFKGTLGGDDIRTRLNTLEDQTYPIALLEDLDGDGNVTTTRVSMVPGGLVRSGKGERDEVFRLVLQEADVS